jgi:hypothetical protein
MPDETLPFEARHERANIVSDVIRFVSGAAHFDGQLTPSVKEDGQAFYMNPWRNVPNEKYSSFAHTKDRMVNIVCLLHQIQCDDPTSKSVRREFKKRVEHGIKKYNHTVESNPLFVDEWIQHHIEELMDASVYTARRISDLWAAGVSPNHPTYMWLCSHLSSLCYDTRIVKNQLKEAEFMMLQAELKHEKNAQAGRGDRRLSKEVLDGDPELLDQPADDSTMG